VSGRGVYAYALGNPVNHRDPSGQFVPLITGGIGAAAGGIGSIIGQLYQTGSVSCINWNNVGVSALTGFAAGFAAPFFAVSIPGAIGVGALSNTLNYYATQLVNNDSINTQDAIKSAEIGAAAGFIGGAYTSASDFLVNSPWLSQSIASAVNLENSLALNVTLTNLIRNGVGSAISGGAPLN